MTPRQAQTLMILVALTLAGVVLLLFGVGVDAN